MAPVSMAISLARGYRPGGLHCWRSLPAGKVSPASGILQCFGGGEWSDLDMTSVCSFHTTTEESLLRSRRGPGVAIGHVASSSAGLSTRGPDSITYATQDPLLYLLP